MPTSLRFLLVFVLGLLGACSATRTITIADKEGDLDRDAVAVTLNQAMNSDGYRALKEDNKADTGGSVMGERNGGFAHWFGIQGTTKFNRDGELWRVHVTCESGLGFSTLDSEVNDLTRQVENTLNGAVKQRRTERETMARDKAFIEQKQKEAAAAPAPPPTGRVYALVVGVGSNTGVGRVDKAAADAAQMAKLLQGEKWGPKPENPKVLINQEATKAAILEALQVIEERAQEGDIIVLYFGGNWRAQKGDDFDCYLPYDWKKGAPEKMKALGLTPEEIAGLMKPGRRHVVFLNCNFIGSDDDDYYADRGLLKTQPPLGQKLGNGLNMVFTPGKPEKQASWPRCSGEHSAMVAALTEIVKDSSSAQPLVPEALKSELEKRMPAFVAEQDKPKIQPQLIMDDKNELKAMPVVPLIKARS